MITLTNGEAERLAKHSTAAMQGIAIDQFLAILGQQPPCFEWPIDRPHTYAHMVICEAAPRHLNLGPSPWWADNGECLRAVLILVDVTRQNYQVGQIQRDMWLNTMGEMAANIAPEMRNAFDSMKFFASLLKQDGAGDAEQSVMPEATLCSVKNLNQSISTVLLFSKCPIPRFAAADRHELLEDSIVFFDHPGRHHHLHLHMRLEAKKATVRADRGFLQQVFPLLLLNAFQATPESWDLTLATPSHSDLCEVRISDAGIGIPRHVVEQIFNPLFTTKERGNGLGLTIAHNIVQAQRGNIHIVHWGQRLALSPHSPCRFDAVERPGSRDMCIAPWRRDAPDIRYSSAVMEK
jgi:signal transduction histidine kinase